MAEFDQTKNYAVNNPTDIYTVAKLADTYHYINQLSEAEEVYTNLIKQNPNDDNLYNRFAIFLADTGQIEKSLALFQRAAALNPHPTFYRSISDTLETLGRNKEALAAIEKSIEIKSTFFETHIDRGNILQKLGRREEALQEYLKAYELAPANSEPNYQLALIYVKLGNKEAARRHFEILKSLAPGDAQTIEKLVSAATRKSSVKFISIKV